MTDLWKEGSQVHFQVRNVGYGQAPAPVYAHLQINGQPVDDSSLGAVAAWTRAEGDFPSPLNCSGKSVMATVCAEVTGAVDPNPGDNCLSKELLCDTTPPAFGGRAAVQEIDSGQATVCWTTAEKTTGRVLFDRLSGLWGQTASDGIATADHCVTLSKLEAAAGYRYLVEIQDANGNAARGRAKGILTPPRCPTNNCRYFLRRPRRSSPAPRPCSPPPTITPASTGSVSCLTGSQRRRATVRSAHSPWTQPCWPMAPAISLSRLLILPAT